VKESPEEEDTQVPVAFGPVLGFMETGYEEARTEYFSLSKEHAGDLLATCPSLWKSCKPTCAWSALSPGSGRAWKDSLLWIHI